MPAWLLNGASEKLLDGGGPWQPPSRAHALPIAGRSTLTTLISYGFPPGRPSSAAPSFYRHRRVGLNGTPFDCLKFRTMVVKSDEALRRHLAANSDAAREWETSQKLKRDPRVTPLGRTMRKASVDELPQLVNILKGEMSFVGPRPIVAAEVPKYGECIGHYLRARPGLTGPWQVSGRNDVDYSTRVTLDRHYVEQWSFRRDLTIIASTVRVVVTARGSY
jgi:exopolysaccharide production protein ExoY